MRIDRRRALATGLVVAALTAFSATPSIARAASDATAPPTSPAASPLSAPSTSAPSKNASAATPPTGGTAPNAPSNDATRQGTLASLRVGRTEADTRTGATPPATARQASFGDQTVGATSGAQAFVVASDKEMALREIHVTGDFAVAPPTCALAADGSCALSVTFTPERTGVQTGVISVQDENGKSRVIASVSGTGTARCTQAHWFACTDAHSLIPVVALVVLYWIMLIAFRWNSIAYPSRALLLAEIDALRSRFPEIDVDLPQGAVPTPRQAAMQATRPLLERAIALNTSSGIHPLHFDLLFWCRGSETVGWSLVHEAEEQLVAWQSPDEVRTTLEQSARLLEVSEATGAPALAAQIHTELGRTTVDLADTRRALLAEAQDFLGRCAATLRAEVTAQTAAGAAPAAANVVAFAARLATLRPQATLLAARAAPIAGAAGAGATVLDILVAHVVNVTLPGSGALSAIFVPAAVPADAFAVAAAFMADVAATSARIDAALLVNPPLPLARWKALASEALGIIYARRDTNYASLLSWHNKTIWMIDCGLLLIVALAAALGHGVFFLLGATGGLMSRLSRSLYRADVRTDYGASWTTLFLSPVVGALAGWAGLLLASLAVDVGVLGKVFADISWGSPYAVLSLALAFLFGFSERLFDTVLDQLQAKVMTKPDATVAPLAITGNTQLDAPLPTPFKTTLTASGGKAPYAWRADGLPPWLTLAAATGELTGTPTIAGIYGFVVTVTDAAKATDPKPFKVTVK